MEMVGEGGSVTTGRKARWKGGSQTDEGTEQEGGGMKTFGRYES